MSDEDFAELMQAQRPDLYGGYSADELRSGLSANLADPTRHAKTVAHIRKNFDVPASIPDDVLGARLIKATAPKYAVNHTNPEQIAEDAARAKYGGMMKSAKTMEKERLHAEAETSKNSPTPTTEAQEETAREMVPPLRSVKPGDDSTRPPHLRAPELRIPTYEDWARQFIPALKKEDPTLNTGDKPIPAGKFTGVNELPGPGHTRVNGVLMPDVLPRLESLPPGEGQDVKIIMPGALDTRVIAVKKHEGNRPIAALDSQASFGQNQVPGYNVLSRVGGPGSELQQGAVSAARELWDPSKGSALGEAPKGQSSGYGLPEYAADAAEHMTPTAAEDQTVFPLAKLGTKAQSALAWLQQHRGEKARDDLRAAGGMVQAPMNLRAVIRGEQPLRREATPEERRAMEQEALQNIGEGKAGQREAQRFTEYLDQAKQDPALGQDILTGGAHELGRTGGSAAQQLLPVPSEVGAGLRLAKGALALPAVGRFGRAVAGSATDLGITKPFSTQPNAMAVVPEARTAAKAFQATTRNSPEVAALIGKENPQVIEQQVHDIARASGAAPPEVANITFKAATYPPEKYAEMMTETGTHVRKAANNLAGEWARFGASAHPDLAGKYEPAAQVLTGGNLPGTVDALRQADRVVVQVQGVPLTPQADALVQAGARVVTVKNPNARALGSYVVPRRDALAVTDVTEPFGQGARDLARSVDGVLGNSQGKAVRTIFRFGFSTRNDLGNVIKAVADERNVFDGKNIAAWARISNAKPGVGPDGVLLQNLMEQVGMGHGIKQQALGELSSAKGGTWPSDLARLATGGNPLAGTGGSQRAVGAAQWLEGARDKAYRAIGAPAQAVEHAQTRAAWAGSGVNPQFTTEDNIRMLLTLEKMRRGVSLEKAALDTKGLLLDYADKSVATEFLEKTGIAPFTQYYQATPGALMTLAAKNPRAFGNIYNAMRDTEGVDDALHGGAMDPRNKTPQDQLSAVPWLRAAGGVLAPRPETPLSEAAPYLENLTGNGQGPGQFLGPEVNSAAELATGNRAFTSQPLLPVVEGRAAQSGRGLFGQALQAREDAALPGERGAEVRNMFNGVDPLHYAMFQAAKPWAPATVMDPLQVAMGIGEQPWQRGQGSMDQAFWRKILRAGTGADVTPVSPLANKLAMERRYRPPLPFDKGLKKARQRGQATETPGE